MAHPNILGASVGARGGTWRFLRSPAVMVLVALALRLALMGLVYTQQLAPENDHFDFGYEMGRIARSIATGQGFGSPYYDPTGPTALVAPVYPLLLAGVFKVFGVYTTASALVILSLNNLFSALTCWPIFIVARRIFGPRAGIWSGWVWVFFPYALALPSLWIWETNLTALLLTILLAATLYLERSTNYAAWSGYGLLWGVAALTSPAVISVLPFLGAWIWLRQRKRGASCTKAATFAALIFMICVAPWIARNYRTFGRLMPVRDNFAMEFLVGNTTEVMPLPNIKTILPPDNPAELERYTRMGEAAYMTDRKQKMEEFLKDHPMRFVLLTLRRTQFVWTGLWDLHPVWSLDEMGIPNILATTFLSLLALFGLIRAIRDGKIGAIPLAIMILFFPVTYYVTHPNLRYRHPIDPVIVICAVYGAMCFRGRATESPARIAGG